MFDVAIIGAGPSALIAAKQLLDTNSKIRLIILEQGVSLAKRKKVCSEDVSYGFGGAGLFSDCKLSFPPSASFLWTNLIKEKLSVAYNGISKWLNEYNVILPPIDDKWFNNNLIEGQKLYLSYKLTEEQSEDILKDLEIRLIDYICLNTKVIKVEKKVKTNSYLVNTTKGVYLTKNIIFATGKLGFSNLYECSDANKHEIAEIGIRIEVPNSIFLPYTNSQLDYKYISRTLDYEVRTFCCCKDGQVIKSKFGEYYSFNGMTLKEPTGFSNIGIVIRSLNQDAANKLKEDVSRFINYSNRIPLSLFLSTRSIYSQSYYSMLVDVINKIVNVASIPDTSYVYYPVVEKLGMHYDNFDDNTLQLKNENIWIIGDATYKFRGLLAAFISGEYVANELLKSNTNVKVKASSIEETKVVFTAQSKEYFYCKDVICEYVLKKGATPINPFQVFNYFLNDRVDRALIRRGNNNLILKCDELWVFGKISDGVLFEIKLAKDNRIPVRYFSLGTYISDIMEISLEQVKFDPEIHAKQITKDDLVAFLSDNQCKPLEQINIFDYIDDID